MRVGFVMEQALGHATHHKNLVKRVESDSAIDPIWMPIAEKVDDIWERLPGIRSNWSLKASLRARDALRASFIESPPEALFIHTQTTALFAIPYMNRVPSIVSLDATPLNYDSVGEAYGHKAGEPGFIEHKKRYWNRATFRAAKALVSWCEWAKESLVKDYGVAPEKVTVIPPGVDLDQWSYNRSDPKPANARLRLLFVGGDFTRKGGEYLAQAYNALGDGFELDIVTKEEGAEKLFEGTGAQIHRGLTPNSDKLRDLFAQADIFVFPTIADCLPIAVMEAMAAGLPVITTNVGALNEEVSEGVNGLLVAPKSCSDIVQAVQSLNDDRSKLRAMSTASRQLAEQKFDLHKNYGAILELLKTVKNTEDMKSKK